MRLRCLQCSAATAKIRGANPSVQHFNYLCQVRQSSSSAPGIAARARGAPLSRSSRSTSACLSGRCPAFEEGRSATTLTGIHGLRFVSTAATDARPPIPARGSRRVKSPHGAQTLRFATTASTSVFDGSPPELNHGPTPTSPASPGPRLQIGDGDSLVTFDDLRHRVERLIQYQFADPDYLRLALYAGDARVDNIQIPRSRRQLAVVGDAAYKLLYFADQFPWSRHEALMFSTLASNVHFAEIAKRRSLDDIMHLTRGVTSHWRPQERPATVVEQLATSIEAIIGAVYLDCGRNDGITRMVVDALGLGEPTNFAVALNKETTSKPETPIDPGPSSITGSVSGPHGTSDPPSTAAPVPSNRPSGATSTADGTEEGMPSRSDLVPVVGTREAGESPVPTSPRFPATKRRLHAQRKAARKKQLRKYLPVHLHRTTSRTTLSEIVKAICNCLETSRPGDQIREKLDEILHVLQVFKLGDPCYEDIQALRAQIGRLQGTDQAKMGAVQTAPSPELANLANGASKISNSTDAGDSCTKALTPDAHPSGELGLRSLTKTEGSKEHAVVAVPQALSLRVTHPSPSTFKSTRQRVESIIQYSFRDPDYLKAALAIGPVYIGRTRLLRPQDELAIIGDSIYKAVFFSNRFPSAATRENVHANYERVATNMHLSKIARRLHLGGLAVGSHRRTGLEPSRSQVWHEATLIEALLGAVYLDSGYSISALMRSIDAMELFTPSSFGMPRLPAATRQNNSVDASLLAPTTQKYHGAGDPDNLLGSESARMNQTVARSLHDGSFERDHQVRQADGSLGKYNQASTAVDLPQGRARLPVTASDEGDDSLTEDGATSNKSLQQVPRRCRQRLRKWKDRLLRKQVAGVTTTSSITGILAKLDRRREVLKQDDSQANELREIERALADYHATMRISRELRRGQALPSIADGIALATTCGEEHLSETSAGRASVDADATGTSVSETPTGHKIARRVRKRDSIRRRALLKNAVGVAGKAISISEMLATLEGQREELERDPSQVDELHRIEQTLEGFFAHSEFGRAPQPGETVAEYVFSAMQLSPTELLPILQSERHRLQKDQPHRTDALREVEHALEECHSALRTGEPLREVQDIPGVADAMDVERAVESGATGSMSTPSNVYARFHV